MKRAFPWVMLVAVLWLGARPAPADEPAPTPAPKARLEAEMEATAAGDGKAKIKISFDTPVYEAIKKNIPDPRRFLQDMRSSRADYEIGTSSAVYDDAISGVVLDLVEVGGAKNRGDGRWEVSCEAGYELEKASAPDAPRQTVTFKETGTWDGGMEYEGHFLYRLPAGATDVRWDADRHLLSWVLKYTGGTGTARLAADLHVRDRLMTTVYKVYGLGTDFGAQWIAKTVFRNEGTNVARNLKVRYKLQGYGEWSPWDKYPEVVPGQTVVSVNYPVLDASIARLRSNTPANLLVEWTYDDGTGTKKEDDDAKKVVLLGVNEFVFSSLVAGESFGTWQEGFNNAPLLAAWVTRNDGVVKQLGAMANKNAGGVGSNTDAKSAVAVLKACYELLQLNDFSYQHPPSLSDKTVSFDAHMVQNVKLPRDTIRDRSGTCIDLAILFAAMVNAVGLEPHLALIPGHCFPVIKLPGGQLVGVETTGVSGGIRFGSAGFDRVLEIGTQELQKAQEDGRIYLIDVQSLWTRGVSNPEIEDLPPDILQRWGISEAGRAGGTSTPAPGGPRGNPLDAVLGLWGGPIEPAATIGEGTTLSQLIVGLEKSASGAYQAGVRMDLTVTTPQGAKQLIITGLYDGGVDGDTLVLKCKKRERILLPGGEKSEIDGNTLVVQPGDGKLVGKIGDDDGWLPFTLVPKKDNAPAPASTKPAGPDPFAGALGLWGGDLGVKTADGVLVKQLVVGIDHLEDGAYKAGLMAELVIGPPNARQTVQIIARFTGAPEGDRLKFKTDSRVRKNPETGQETEISPATLYVKMGPGRIEGRMGNDADGWTDFTLVPKKD